MSAAASATERLPAPLLLVVSRALQALATPVVALLIATAGDLVERKDAVSFCNVLFVGNLCASFVVLVSFGPSRIAGDLRGLKGFGRVEVLIFGGLSALLSALIFSALATTTVTNAVLLARLGPVLYALGATRLIGSALRASEWVGFGLVALGVLATVFTGAGFEVATGDLLILGSALVFAVVQVLGKRLSPQIGIAGLVFARNFLSAIIFFFIAASLYGWQHFADAFYGPLWGIMLVYALVVIVAAQFAWYGALGRMSPAAIARWTVLSPLLAVSYAFAINGEVPGLTQLTALAFVTTGILISTLGKPQPPPVSDAAENSLAAG